MTEFQDKCPQCDTAIPDGTDVCPGCQAQLVFCFDMSCCKPYPAQMERCPACGAENEMVEVFREASAGQEGDAQSSEAASDALSAAPSGSPGEAPSTPKPDSAGFPGAGSRLAVPSPDLPPASTAPAAPAMSPEDMAGMLADFVQKDAAAASTPPALHNLVPQPAAGMVASMPSAEVAFQAALSAGAVGLPGDVTSLLATTGVSVSKLTLEADTSQSPKRGQQGLLRFRVTAAEEAQVELVATSGFWPVAERLETRVAAGEQYEFPALKFIPRVAGTEEVQIVIGMRNAAGAPVGRWQATYDLTIEDVVREMGGSIQAEVVIMGGPGGPNLPGLGGAMPGMPPIPALAGLGGGWQTLTLRPDPEFQRRMALACPESEAPPHSLPGPPLAGHAVVHAVVHLSEEASGRFYAVAVVCGASASLGRGGDPNVAWWLEPFPHNPQQHRRLSRQHTFFSLRDGRAWVTDRSTNGTSFNGHHLKKETPEMLTQGDQIDPADVCTLLVRLEANQGRVHAVWLDRCDALSDQLRYVLTDGRAPVRLTVPGVPTPLWLAWIAEPGRAMQLALQAGGDWTMLETNQKALLFGGWHLCWQLLARPQPQQEYLRRLT